jgi:hypothetical protein
MGEKQEPEDRSQESEGRSQDQGFRIQHKGRVVARRKVFYSQPSPLGGGYPRYEGG